MPKVTSITEQKRRPNRRSVFIDGEFAFGCSVNVIARFRLREGMAVDPALRKRMEEGEVQQEAFDHAMRLISRRMQSERELRTKLGRKEYGTAAVNAVVENLRRLGYVDDEQFARNRAAEQAKVKKVGRQRAIQELRKAGIDQTTAERVAAEVYQDIDPRQSALDLARKKAAVLKRLDPPAARRRLVGFLQRRGFDFETIRYVLERALDGERIR